MGTWTEEQRQDLRQLARYALAIFGAIALTLVVWAVISSYLPSDGAIAGDDTATSTLVESTPPVGD
jgi:uncharacterized membrane protein